MSQGCSLLLCCAIAHQSLLMLVAESVLHSDLPKGRCYFSSFPFFLLNLPPCSCCVTREPNAEHRHWIEQKLSESQMCQGWIYFCLKQGLEGKEVSLQREEEYRGGGGKEGGQLSRPGIAFFVVEGRKRSWLLTASLQRISLQNGSKWLSRSTLAPQHTDWPQERIRKKCQYSQAAAWWRS